MEQNRLGRPEDSFCRLALPVPRRQNSEMPTSSRIELLGWPVEIGRMIAEENYNLGTLITSGELSSRCL